MIHEIFEVKGIDCPNCAKSCEDVVTRLDFVCAASINLVSAQLDVSYREGVTPGASTLRKIVDAVRSTNHDLALTEEQKELIDDKRSWYEENRELILMVSSGVLIALGLFLELLIPSFASFSRIQAGLYILSAVLGLGSIFPVALNSLKRKKIDMNVLMSIAVIGAIFLGAYIEAAVVIFLDQVGEYLEGYSMRKTRGSIRKLMALAPEEARVWTGAGYEMRPVANTPLGSRIQVRPGERIPLDGRIVVGASAIDESPVTGESVPVDRGVGELVYAGSLNTNALIELETTADMSNSMLARIVSMVEGAQAKKAPYEDFVDRFASWYTPLVVITAALIAVLPPLITQLGIYDMGSWSRWIYTALTILVISCPCALVISTPVSFVSGITKAARMGVLVKGGAFMEIASRVDAVFFDKTGTLTQGKPRLQESYAFEGLSKEKLLHIAASLEVHSNHPLALAVDLAYKEQCADKGEQPCYLETSSMQEIAGNGVQAVLEGSQYFLGKQAFIAHKMGRELDSQLIAQVEELEKQGATVLCLARQETSDIKLLGILAVADALRPEAEAVLDELRGGRLQIEQLEMLTGDNPRTAHAVAQELGLTSVHAGLLPEDKIARVEKSVAQGRQLAMVGDGINDAPALAAAQLGITMGGAASDTALEVADVALMSGGLKQLPGFLRLSRRTMSIVKQNIAFAIGIKLLFLILALFGLTSMWMAVFADTGVTLLVILNGMRLLLGEE